MRIPVEKLIMDKYYEIIERHGNPQWTIETLEWLIYEAFKQEYYNLNPNERADVDHMMWVLRKVKLG